MALLIQGHLASSGVAFESLLKKNVQSQTGMFLGITGTTDASPSRIRNDIQISADPSPFSRGRRKEGRRRHVGLHLYVRGEAVVFDCFLS